MLQFKKKRKRKAPPSIAYKNRTALDKNQFSHAIFWKYIDFVKEDL